MLTRRYRLDASVQRYGTTMIGGSPLTLFRLTEAGAASVDRLAAGESMAASPLIERLVEAGAVHPVPEPAPGVPFRAADVTVVVPTLGAPRHAPPGAIIVDDGSDPPVPNATIRLDANRGPAAARNAGLAAVTTPLVAFVDGDVDLPREWLDALLPHFVDSRVAAVAPRIAARDRPGRLGRYEHDNSPLDMGPEPARVRAGSRVSYVPAAVLVCRVEAIRAAGGFDTAMRYGEDVDLIWRLADAGWRIRYEPTSVARHEPRPDWRAWTRQRIGYGSSAGPLAVRHPRKLAPLRMSGWSIAVWVLAAAGRPMSGAAVGLGSAAALIPKLPDVPARDAFRFAAVGNARAGWLIAHTVRRAWWPILALLAIRSTTARRALVVSLLAVRDPRELADDLAYSVGVWKGMLAARTVDPIVPEIISWPGRSRASRPEPGSARDGSTNRFRWYRRLL